MNQCPSALDPSLDTPLSPKDVGRRTSWRRRHGEPMGAIPRPLRRAPRMTPVTPSKQLATISAPIFGGLHLCNGNNRGRPVSSVLRNATWIPLLNDLDGVIDVAHLEATYFAEYLERNAFRDLPQSIQLAAGSSMKPTTGWSRPRRSKSGPPIGFVASARTASGCPRRAGSDVTACAPATARFCTPR
jgi:hypothetical protein